MQEVKEEQLISFDYAMKSLLRDKANFDILEGFLTALFKEFGEAEDIKIIELVESESNKESLEKKISRCRSQNLI